MIQSSNGDVDVAVLDLGGMIKSYNAVILLIEELYMTKSLLETEKKKNKLLQELVNELKKSN